MNADNTHESIAVCKDFESVVVIKITGLGLVPSAPNTSARSASLGVREQQWWTDRMRSVVEKHSAQWSA